MRQDRAVSIAEQRRKLGASWGTDQDKPIYHICPRQGWANDGNGFIYYKNRYHIFYQHIEDSSQWAWRMCWGHVSSADLINWQHEPLALRPTPGGPDEKGCWSGCCAVDQHGVPTILYTGVRMGAGPSPGTPEGEAVGQPVIEVQCAATASLEDALLQSWTKCDAPIIDSAPAGLRVMGFRDPYVIQRGGNGRDWRIVIGSGIADEGGALLVYASKELTSGWRYEGPLCVGKQRTVGGHDTGAMWECPFLIPLASATPPASNGNTANLADKSPAEVGRTSSTAQSNGARVGAEEGEDYVMCVSPYPHRGPATNSCLYWLGKYCDGRFDPDSAEGPFVLDLGDMLYAPNCFRDGGGRHIMLGWFQESASRQGDFDYSGCLTLPRILTRQGGRLHQEPAPELVQLRQPEHSWQSAQRITVSPDRSFPVPAVHGAALEVDVTLRRASEAATGASVLLYSEPEGPAYGGVDEEPADCCAVAITVSWTDRSLKVIWPRTLDSEGMAFDLAGATREVGGPAAVGEDVRMRVFLDHSALEVFLGTGEALTTRIYRRHLPATGGPTAGVYIVAHGGEVDIVKGEAYLMGTIWQTEE